MGWISGKRTLIKITVNKFIMQCSQGQHLCTGSKGKGKKQVDRRL